MADQVVIVQDASANQNKALLCFIIALILFLVGLFTFVLWICLWPAALVFFIMGIFYLAE